MTFLLGGSRGDQAKCDAESVNSYEIDPTDAMDDED